MNLKNNARKNSKKYNIFTNLKFLCVKNSEKFFFFLITKINLENDFSKNVSINIYEYECIPLSKFITNPHKRDIYY